MRSIILEENEYADISQRIADVKAVFMEGLSNHTNDQGSFPVIDGALQFVERIRKSADVRVAIATGCWEVTYFGDGEWDQRACKELGWQFVAVGPRLGGIESFRDIQV